MNLENFMDTMTKYFSKANIKNTIAVISVVLSFSFLIILLFHPVPEGNRDLVNVLGGVILGVAINSVFGWLYTDNKKDKITP